MDTIWVEASAGCGKTTLILNDFYVSNKDSLFISFSNATVNEFQARLSNKNNIKCSTIHSLAFDFLKLWNPNLIIQEKSLINEVLAELLQNENFKTLYNWLIKNDDLKLDIDLDSLDNFELNEEIPLINDVYYDVLFSNKLIFYDELDEFVGLFFNKNGSERKRIKIEINSDKNIKSEYIKQLKKRVELHQKLYKKYVFNIKKHVKNALKIKEKELKIQKNIIYYNDLLTLCIDLIKSEPEIVFKILGNVKNIYIDETQDLSDTQFDLILSILQEWNSIGERLLIVGDPKQLIYEFQGANLKNYKHFKQKIKNISCNFNEKYLNKTYRLPIKICEKLNDIGKNLDIEYKKHETMSLESGELKILEIEKNSDILPFLNDDTMILFKQKNDDMKNLAILFMKNGYFINSPYIIEHPIIKDFQYLLKWLIYKDQFALGVLMHIFDKYEMSFEKLLKEKQIIDFLDSLNFSNLNDLFTKWIFNFDVQSFLSKNLGKSMYEYIELLRQYCAFYKYKAYDAIYDNNEFYKNSGFLFKGIFFNTIHSAKGKESDTVILLNCDFNAKFKHDTNRLLYVGLTRTKNKLIIPIVKNSGKWLDILLE